MYYTHGPSVTATRRHRVSSLANCRAFTLIEVAAAVLVLSILLSGILVAFRRTTDGLAIQSLREKAVAIAQSRMEFLLAQGREPNNMDLHGQDEADPLFEWQMELVREVPGSAKPRPDLSNTVIKVSVSVRYNAPETAGKPLVELVRYFAALKPIPGQAVAVPLTPQIPEEPQWYLELREKLGREPTADEALIQLIKMGDLPPDIADELGITLEPNEITGPL